MEELTSIIETATKNIKEHYFLLPRYQGSDVLRERHYCYELYHQMRCLWPNDCNLILSGEIDKSSHHFIGNLIGSYPIPDFLIHTPSEMNNEAIIEVKTDNFQANGIEKDIKTLSIFIERADYNRAILLIFGKNITQEKIDNINNIYSNLSNKINVQPIEVWIHDEVNRGARLIYELKKTD